MFHGAPEVLRKSISMNIVYVLPPSQVLLHCIDFISIFRVAVDPDVQRPTGPLIRYFDGRRVMSLNQVTTSSVIRNEFKIPTDS